MINPALLIGACLFAVGMFGFLTRRNLILMFLSLELMLAGVSLNFVVFGQLHGDFGGQVFSIFILVVAACEAALALSLIVALVRLRGTLDSKAWSALREFQFDDEAASGGRPSEDKIPELAGRAAEDHSHPEGYEDLPKLTPAGLDPQTRPVDSDFKLPDLAGRA
jgi:NADH-quinone oxidoreductase subunit K